MNLDVDLLFVLGGHMEKGETVSVKTKPKLFHHSCSNLGYSPKEIRRTDGRIFLLIKSLEK